PGDRHERRPGTAGPQAHGHPRVSSLPCPGPRRGGRPARSQQGHRAEPVADRGQDGRTLDLSLDQEPARLLRHRAHAEPAARRRRARAVTAYLMTLGTRTPAPDGLEERLANPENIADGEKLVRKYGCPGCHDIPGMESESRVGAELS